MPKREPNAAICFAYGEFRAKMAEDPNTPPSGRPALREDARESYQKALAIDPKYLDAHIGLAHLYLQMGNYDQAVVTYRRATEKLPNAAGLWFELGICQARHKDWDLAADSLRTAARLDPDNTGYAKTLAFTLARGGHFDESFEVFKKSVGEPQAHYNIARMLHHVNQDESCKQHLRLAIQQKPDLVAAQQFLDELQRPNSPGGKDGAVVAFEDLEETPAQNVGAGTSPSLKSSPN